MTKDSDTGGPLSPLPTPGTAIPGKEDCVLNCECGEGASPLAPWPRERRLEEHLQPSCASNRHTKMG